MIRREAGVDDAELLHQLSNIEHGQIRLILMKLRPVLLLLGALLSLASIAPTKSLALDAPLLAAQDTSRKEMDAKADVDGLAALASPDLKINSPTNRILTRDQFIAMMRSGQISAEAFERTVESATVSGNVGVVMGSEVSTTTASIELGKAYGSRPLKRRYTNIYVVDTERWRWLARHANVMPGQATNNS